jgi:CheY-like chemotaxis protein
MNQEVLKALLSKNGSEVDEALNGQEAVSMSLASRYDLIFMDCMMPKMDGYEATRSIRTNLQNPNTETPIIALTANDLKGDRTKCLEVGMDDYLTKPIMPASLSAILATWASKASAK